MSWSKSISPDYQIIYGATNSGKMPSDLMPTRTHAEKSMAIVAFCQEMALAGMIYANSLGESLSHDSITATRSSLLSIYERAGFENPALTLGDAEILLSNELIRLKLELSSNIRM